MEPQQRAPTGTPLQPGDPPVVGSYELRGRIGEGGMGVVYLGRAPDGHEVAVKVVRQELAGDPGFLARFRDEVVNAERVASFCTAQVLDHGEVGGRAYMVTELIDGPSLAEYVAGSGALSPGMLHGVAVGVATALVAIHSAGLVHRDLKPRNVLLSISGPRVIDFGIARALDAASEHTKTGQLIGSPGWIAPELILGQGVTPAVDIFAWGCLIGYAGTGRHPFGQGNFQMMAARLMHAEPDLGSLPVGLSDLVRTALDKNPRHRPAAQDLLLSLIGGTSRAAVQETLVRSWAPAQPPLSVPVPPPGPPPVPAAFPMSDSPTAAGSPAAHSSAAPATVPQAIVTAMPTQADIAAPTVPAKNAAPPAEIPTEPARRTPARKPRRSGALLAGGIALATVAAVSGGLALKSAFDHSSDDQRQAGGGATAAATPQNQKANAAAPPADPLLVRLDREPGWPKKCHGSIALYARGASPANPVPKPLLPDEQCDMLPHWSQNHQRLAFTRVNGHRSDLMVVNADGSGLQKVTEVNGVTRVAWSPDGKQLAYGDGDASNRDIFVITIGSPSPQQVTSSGSSEGGPDWSHDGRRLAFWSDRDGPQQIYTLDIKASGKPWTKVTSTPYGADDPVWSPDDKRIAYTYINQNKKNDIWVTDADGRDNRRLTDNPAHEMDPNWSRDGRWIAFVRGATETPCVWAVRIDGTGEQRLTPKSALIGHPSWT